MCFLALALVKFYGINGVSTKYNLLYISMQYLTVLKGFNIIK